MVVQEYVDRDNGYVIQIPKELVESFSEHVETYSKLDQALNKVDLEITGTPFFPKIGTKSYTTGKELSPKQLESKIYDLGANLWGNQEHNDLVNILESRYGNEFLEELSPEYKNILLQEESKIAEYVQQGIIKAEPVIRKDYVWTEKGQAFLKENAAHTQSDLFQRGPNSEPISYNKKTEERLMAEGLIAGVHETDLGYVEFDYTKKGRNFLNANPDKNPELYDLIGHTPGRDKRKSQRKKWLAYMAALAMGGAAGAVVVNSLSDTDDKVKSNVVVQHNSAPYEDGNSSTGVLHNSYRNPANNQITVVLASEIDPQTGDSQYNVFNLPNGTNNMSSQELIEELNWLGYPWSSLQHQSDWSRMVKIVDSDGDNVNDAIEDIGAFPGHTNYQPRHNEVPSNTSIAMQDGNWTLLKDGQQVYSKGVDFSPIDPSHGGAYNWMENQSNYNQSLKDLVASGVNSIKIQAPANLEDGMQFLDAAHEAGLDVYINLDQTWEKDYQNNSIFQKVTLKRADRVVNAYKNHSAVAGWVLGNDKETSPGFYSFANDTLAPQVKQLDPNHVTVVRVTADNFADADQNLSAVDVIDVSTYDSSNLSEVWNAIAGATHPVAVTHGASAYQDVADSNESVNRTLQAQKLSGQLEDLVEKTDRFNPNSQGVIASFVSENVDQHWRVTNSSLDHTQMYMGNPDHDPVPEEYRGITSWKFDGANGKWIPQNESAVHAVEVGYDVVPPVVSFGDDALNVNHNYLVVSADGTDNVGFESLAINLLDSTGALEASNLTNGTHAEVRFSNLTDGNHTAVLVGKDEAGLITTQSRIYNIDTETPQVNFGEETPKDGAFVNKSYFVANVSFSDNELVTDGQINLSHESEVIRQMFIEEPKLAGYLLANFTELEDKQYQLGASVNDSVGNSVAKTRNITVDTTLPEILLDENMTKTGRYENETSIKVAFSVDDINYQKSIVELRDSNGSLVRDAIVTNESVVDYTFEHVPRGLYTIGITSIDKANNSRNLNEPGIELVNAVTPPNGEDVIPPSIEFGNRTTAAEPALNLQNDIVVNVTVSDNNAVGGAHFYLLNASNPTDVVREYSINSSVNNSLIESFEHTFKDLKSGRYTLLAVGEDANDNEDSVARTIRVIALPTNDADSPMVSLDVESGQLDSNHHWLNATLNAEDGDGLDFMGLYVYQQDPSTGNLSLKEKKELGTTELTDILNQNFTLENGKYTLLGLARDSQDSENVTSESFDLTNFVPQPGNETPTSNSHGFTDSAWMWIKENWQEIAGAGSVVMGASILYYLFSRRSGREDDNTATVDAGDNTDNRDNYNMPENIALPTRPDPIPEPEPAEATNVDEGVTAEDIERDLEGTI